MSETNEQPKHTQGEMTISSQPCEDDPSLTSHAEGDALGRKFHADLSAALASPAPSPAERPVPAPEQTEQTERPYPRYFVAGMWDIAGAAYLRFDSDETDRSGVLVMPDGSERPNRNYYLDVSEQYRTEITAAEAAKLLAPKPT